METIADQIEAYIKEMLAHSEEGVLELRRSDLAETFMCVPSQINYVLETRFNAQQGYFVESRRGGGGYLRIVRLTINPDQDLEQMVEAASNKRFSQQAGEGLLNRLVEEGFLTRREGKLLKSMIDNNVLKHAWQDREQLRGALLKTVLINILREDFEKEE